jgi:Uma2 family endonuclease
MSVVNHNIRFTYEDYKSLPEDSGKRYELVDGDLLMVPAPTTRHQLVSVNVLLLLQSFVRAHGLGTILHAPVDLVFTRESERDVLQPDIVFISRARAAILQPAEIQGAPDLVVEILSPSTEDRDRGFKRRLYGRYGVLEYWIVDPAGETVEVIRARDDQFNTASTYGMGDTFTTPLLQGLIISLKEIFRVD